jgi:hypothetical protein
MSKVIDEVRGILEDVFCCGRMANVNEHPKDEDLAMTFAVASALKQITSATKRAADEAVDEFATTVERILLPYDRDGYIDTTIFRNELREELSLPAADLRDGVEISYAALAKLEEAYKAQSEECKDLGFHEFMNRPENLKRILRVKKGE